MKWLLILAWPVGIGVGVTAFVAGGTWLINKVFKPKRWDSMEIAAVLLMALFFVVGSFYTVAPEL